MLKKAAETYSRIRRTIYKRASTATMTFACLALFSTLLSSPALSFDCPNGATVNTGPSVDVQKICGRIIEYVKPGTRDLDPRLAKYIGVPDVRSFAFVISIAKYPKFADPNDRTLEAVVRDRKKI